MIGVYRIVHIATGREYVGQSADLAKRWNAHRRNLNAKTHHAPHLQAAWTKYGEDAFTFEVLKICERADLDAVEQLYLDQRPAFNTALFARTRRGVPQSADAKARNSAAHRGRKRSPEACAAISAGLKGLKHSPEAKAKMRAAKLGRVHTEESRQNMTAAQRRRARPAGEYDSRRGRPRDPETIRKSSEARRGAKRTPEQIAKMKAAAAAMTPEKRAAIAQARRDAIVARRQKMEG